MPSYIERRRRLLYAKLNIPEDVRDVLGKMRFVQSLKTDSRSAAERYATPLISRWKMQIDQARANKAGNRDPLEDEARSWREALLDAKDDDERQLILDLIRDKVDAIIMRSAPAGEIGRPGETPWEELPGQENAEKFFGLATGRRVPLLEHLDQYLASTTARTNQRSKDMARSDITRFAKEFELVSDVNRRNVQRWAIKLMSDDGEGRAPNTVRRLLSSNRGYWRYLLLIGVVPDDAPDPFANLEIARSINGRAKRPSPETARRPFDPADVVRLLHAVEERGDQQMADLIRLAMWTGCRIEELCALKVDRVSGDYIEIEDAKTSAGWRQVPIHSKLQQTMERLCQSSTDGYVLSGIPAGNKYGKRSPTMVSRFRRLKNSLDFDKRYVFHSIRKTVVTILENAGVAEGVVADIVGHKKPTMTYGLYSGGATLATKKKALAKLAYPFSR